jgi:hypothetical protein
MVSSNSAINAIAFWIDACTAGSESDASWLALLSQTSVIQITSEFATSFATT